MTTTNQLDAAALHAAAREGVVVPFDFQTANEDVKRAERAYRGAVAARHELVREARKLGVSWVALSHWTGLNPRTLHTIVNGDDA